MQLLGMPLLIIYTYTCMTFIALNEVGTVTLFIFLVTHCLGYFVDNDSFSNNENRTVLVFLLAPFLIIVLYSAHSAIKSTRFVHVHDM